MSHKSINCTDLPGSQDRVVAKSEFALDRRDFLRSGAAGLVVCFTVALTDREALAGSGSKIGAYIQIDSDGKTPQGNIVTVYVGSTEMGQGIMTGLAQLVAEELNIPWSQVRVEHAPASADFANPMFKSQLTGGSTSMRGWYTPLRQAAAIAREQLRSAAAKTFNVSDASLVTMSNGMATYGSSSLPYSSVAALAATLPAPTSAPTLTSSNFTMIGKRLSRTDIPAKIDGSAVFGIDVKTPGMVYAAVQHCPTIGGTVKTLPAKPASALAIVNLTNAVAIVATDTWTAIKLAEALSVTWTIPTTSNAISSANIQSTSLSLLGSSAPVGLQIIENSDSVVPGAPETALAAAVKSIDASYQLPHLAHACMEPLSCTASVTATSCEIWAPTQAQNSCLATALKLLPTLTAAQVKINTTYLGGGLGRKMEQDFIAQAILISKAVAKPVKLTWSRKQDFQNDKYRPSAFIRVQAGLDANGNLSSFIYRNVASSISKQNNSTKNDTGAVAGATGLPYAIGNRRIEFVPNNIGVPLGYWRSVGESYNVFAVESAIDELSRAGGQQDPMAFRRKLLAGKTRALAVLDAVAAMSGWSSAPPTGRARGVSFMVGFGSIIAMVAEISVNATDGRVVVNKVYCAIDCGTAVNPDSVEAQMQGGIVHGLAATLWGEVPFSAGKTAITNFNSYRMVKLKEMPLVSVQIINSDGPIGGVGETAVPCVAPAVANAYAALKGVRVRTLPFYPGSTMSGL